MAITKKWFKYFNEAREAKEKQLTIDYGRPLTDEEKEKLLPPENKRVHLLNATLVMFSKECDALIAKFYNDSDEGELSICIGAPYLFKFTFEVGLKIPYYKKCFRRLSDKGFLQSTGMSITTHRVHFSWFQSSHYCDPALNEGWSYYKTWGEIVKGEKEVFTVVSKKDSEIINRYISVQQRDNWQPITPFINQGTEVPVHTTLEVKEKLFLTRYKRWLPKIEQTYELNIKGGPVFASGMGKDKEVFSYQMGADYLVPVGKARNVQEAIDYYVETLKRRI